MPYWRICVSEGMTRKWLVSLFSSGRCGGEWKGLTFAKVVRAMDLEMIIAVTQMPTGQACGVRGQVGEP